MWTYLAIFFSLILLLGIYVRRNILFLKKIKNPQQIKENPDEIEPDEEKEKLKLKKEEKEKVDILYKQGEVFLKNGNDDEAIKSFVQVLSINPDHLETQRKLALLYLQKEMYSVAAALFGRLANLTNDAVHYSHLGFSLYQQSSFEEAKEAYQKAVSLDPSRPQRFISLSQVYRSLNQGQNAVITLNKAIELDGNQVDFWYLLADLQLELGNVEEAKAALKRLFELDPKNVEAKALIKKIEKIK